MAEDSSERPRPDFDLGYQFRRQELLSQALTHPSAAGELGLADNERLEFLGDAVLQLVTSEWLYRSYPDEPEGFLTRRRSRLVSGAALKQLGERLDLGVQLVLSEGEARTGGRTKRSILANAVEAIVGAIYLDGGLSAASAWLLPHLVALQDSLGDAELKDAKSTLQELLQGSGRPLPTYRTVRTDGPSHAPSFEVECVVEGEVLGTGSGSSKQQAQRRAAESALAVLRG